MTSYSQFSTFGFCPRRWQLSRKYEPKYKHAALMEGDAMHQALAKFYGTASKQKADELLDHVFSNIRQEMEESGAHADKVSDFQNRSAALVAVFQTYVEQVGVPDLNRFEFEALEEPFKVDLGNGLTLDGVVDGVWKDRETKIRYLVEHKYKQSFNSEMMHLDLQVSLYTLALIPRFGILPTLYNVILKPMHKPKSGEKPAEFGARVLAACREDLVVRSGVEISGRVVRNRYTRGRRDLEMALSQIRAQRRSMDELTADPSRVWRNIGDQCVYMCPFREICVDEDALAVNALFVEKSQEKKEVKCPSSMTI